MRPWLNRAEPTFLPPAIRLMQAGDWAGAQVTTSSDVPGVASNQNSQGWHAAASARRPRRDPEAVAQRLADWADEARRSGRMNRADALLLLAWEAYDTPRIGSRRSMHIPVPALPKRPALVLLLAS